MSQQHQFRHSGATVHTPLSCLTMSHNRTISNLANKQDTVLETTRVPLKIALEKQLPVVTVIALAFESRRSSSCAVRTHEPKDAARPQRRRWHIWPHVAAAAMGEPRAKVQNRGAAHVARAPSPLRAHFRDVVCRLACRPRVRTRRRAH